MPTGRVDNLNFELALANWPRAYTHRLYLDRQKFVPLRSLISGLIGQEATGFRHFIHSLKTGISTAKVAKSAKKNKKSCRVSFALLAFFAVERFDPKVRLL